MSNQERISAMLVSLYGEEKGRALLEPIMELVKQYKIRAEQDTDKKRPILFSEKDVILITYGDSLKRDGEKPLTSLHRFALDHLKELISTIHILPCFPFSSDDGFSVIDYAEIDPALGTWQDIRDLSTDFKLMLDLVLNHISAKSPWVQKYLAGEKTFENLAIETDPTLDLSMVTRPRALPLLTEFTKENGETVHLWTTFSADQVDLNFRDPDVLLKMVEVLLLYAKEGGSIVRLDAIAYLWKEIGTTCIHLEQTHTVVKLLRTLFEMVRPGSIVLTETNVPHEENISYFGNGTDEAQMVYNFTLPPLLLYSFITQDSRILSKWAKSLKTPSKLTTFFNFTASHDGIGVRPLEGIVSTEEVEKILERVKQNRGKISYKQNSDGSKSPYELNLTYVDAFSTSAAGDAYQARRFLASQAIQLVLPGVPAIYVHSILGSHNWLEGAEQTGRARTINREKLDVDQVIEELQDVTSFRHEVFAGYSHLLKVRRAQPAFHPNASFKVSRVHHGVFAIIRRCPTQTIYSFTNITSRNCQLDLEKAGAPARLSELTDLLSGQQIAHHILDLEPYETVWLTPGS